MGTLPHTASEVCDEKEKLPYPVSNYGPMHVWRHIRRQIGMKQVQEFREVKNRVRDQKLCNLKTHYFPSLPDAFTCGTHLPLHPEGHCRNLRYLLHKYISVLETRGIMM